ncbi:hypothetical protein C8T65DRAFT_84855 [Cerioporus squamosus]|nr:hypothetical protein C8T65DRAFT_84855 [Cerioporus squamosus]
MRSTVAPRSTCASAHVLAAGNAYFKLAHGPSLVAQRHSVSTSLPSLDTLPASYFISSTFYSYMPFNLKLGSCILGPPGLGLGALDWDGADEFDGHKPEADEDDELASDVEQHSSLKGMGVMENDQPEEDDSQESEKEVEQSEEEDSQVDDDNDESEKEVEQSGEEDSQVDDDDESEEEHAGPSGHRVGVPDCSYSIGESSRRIRSTASLGEITNISVPRRNLRPRATAPPISGAVPAAVPATRTPSTRAAKPKGKGKAVAQAPPSPPPRGVKSGSRKRCLSESDYESENEDPTYQDASHVSKSRKGTEGSRISISKEPKAKESGLPKKMFDALTVAKTGEVRCPFYLDNGRYSPSGGLCTWTTPRHDRLAQHMEHYRAHRAQPDTGRIGGAEVVKLIRAGKLKWDAVKGLTETKEMFTPS